MSEKLKVELTDQDIEDFRYRRGKLWEMLYGAGTVADPLDIDAVEEDARDMLRMVGEYREEMQSDGG